MCTNSLDGEQGVIIAVVVMARRHSPKTPDVLPAGIGDVQSAWLGVRQSA
jgi:hypothetical protein